MSSRPTPAPLAKANPITEFPQSIPITTTQRAYTLRLRPAVLKGDSKEKIERKTKEMQEALWATHEAVNKGAKVFGDWLLTLRGGLEHHLADEKVKEKKGERSPTTEERRDRRILLAISWLSVESISGLGDSHHPFIVARSTDSEVCTYKQGHRCACCHPIPAKDETSAAECRGHKLLVRLRNILMNHEVPIDEVGDPDRRVEEQPNTWIADCASCFSSPIRQGAAWIDRHSMFNAMPSYLSLGEARKDAYTLLAFLLKEDFLSLGKASKPKKQKADDAKETSTEKQTALSASSKGAGQRTRHAFSHLFGEGKPFGKPTRKLRLRDSWQQYLKPLLDQTGIPLIPVETTADGKRLSSKHDGPAHTEIQRQMFSKAASRIAQIVTKQRQQEFDRLGRRNDDAELAKMEQDESFAPALAKLHRYCEIFGGASGSLGEFRIRPRQISGWDRVVAAWSKIKESDPELATKQREDAAKVLQDPDSDSEKKFGDINLFLRLADEYYRDVWSLNGKANHAILERFVAGTKARSDAKRLKVAAYRHPDPYRSPIFCQFGVSKPRIEFRRLKAFTREPEGNDVHAIGALLWSPKDHAAKVFVMHGFSQRMDREIGAACDGFNSNANDVPPISRRTRLSAAASGLSELNGSARVTGVFDLQKVNKRALSVVEPEQEEDDTEEVEAELKEPKWNGTLEASRLELTKINDLIERASRETDPREASRLSADALRRRGRLRWSLTVSLEMEVGGPWIEYFKNSRDKTPFLRTIQRDILKDKTDPARGLRAQMGQQFVSAEGWPWQEVNKPLMPKPESDDPPSLTQNKDQARGDKATLILSRLPGLRILSVDLGFRFAAAGAVWQCLSADDFREDIAAKIGCNPEDVSDRIEQEHANPTGENGKSRFRGALDGVFLQIDYKSQRKGDAAPKARTAVYRRIGDDLLDDKKSHPAPWVRLERQFPIKLQGEERPARAASGEELWKVHCLEKRIGLAVPLIDRLAQSGWGREGNQKDLLNQMIGLGWKPLPKTEKEMADPQPPVNPQHTPRVDELMSNTVRNVRLALRRHAERARIAFAFDSKFKPLPGDRKYWFEEPHDQNEKESDAALGDTSENRIAKHVEYLQDELARWHQLATSEKWDDEENRGDVIGAIARWNEYILPIIEKANFTYPPSLSEKDAKIKKKAERWEKQVQRWGGVWSKLKEPLARRVEEEEDEKTAAEHKADREALRALLQPVAEGLHRDPALRKAIHDLFAKRWLDDEGNRRVSLGSDQGDFVHFKSNPNGAQRTSSRTVPRNSKDGGGWYSTLSELRNWLAPRGIHAHIENGDEKKEKAQIQKIKAARNVGGLSLTRIDTLVEFRRALIQFRTGGTPWGRVEIRNRQPQLTEPRELGENYAKHLLDVIDQLREQRSKQLASRIAEAALGIGSEDRKHWHGNKRPTQLLQDKDCRFKQCHAVVVEALDGYKPDEVRSKRENRLLGAWRKADFKKRLKEECQLHGLHLREIMPNYTSRQDSRTGAPGIRCDEVKVHDFLTAPWWRKRVKTAKENLEKAQKDREKGKKTEPDDCADQMLAELDKRWPEYKNVAAEARSDYRKRVKDKTLLLPVRGGDIFACANSNHSTKHAIYRAQADLNAAANIGLRALLDPDFSGKWWYVPCNVKDGKPVKEKVKGSTYLASMPELLSKESRAFASGSYVNAWRDPRVESGERWTNDPSAPPGEWLSTSEYKQHVRKRVVQALCLVNREKSDTRGDPETRFAAD